MQVILLAAGYGTRLRPYSALRPKPLFPVLNRPLLVRLLDQLQTAAPVLVNCHHLAEQIRMTLADRPEILLQHEPEILGTGGSLRRAMARLNDAPVLVMNGDIYHDIDLEALYAMHQRSGLPVTLALHHYPRFNKVAVQNGLVQSFNDEATAQDRGLLAFTGIHVLNREIIARIPPNRFYHIIDLYAQLAAQGLVGYQQLEGIYWRDIGTPEDYLTLHHELLQRQAMGQENEPLSQVHCPRDWLIDPAARLGSGVKLKGWGCIGPGAIIGAGAQLSCCVVWDGAAIATQSQYQDTILV